MDYFSCKAGNSWVRNLNATLCKYALISILAGLILLLGTAIEVGAKSYREIALGSLKNLPADARIRADLEASIAAQANAYRQSKGTASLQASSRLRDAARAQA